MVYSVHHTVLLNDVRTTVWMRGYIFLFFRVDTGVGHQFHSRTPQLFPILLRQLHLPVSGDEAHVRPLIASALLHMNTRMAEYTRKEHCAVVWEVLGKYLSELFAAWGMLLFKGS